MTQSRFMKLCEAVRERVWEVSTDEIAARLGRADALVLIDVREESEVALGRIKGAHAIGRGILEHKVEQLFPDTATEIVLYCGGGSRSLLAGESLQRMGYTNVRSMAGVWREWTAKKLPVE